jgi:subtilisin family serine protease
VQQIVELLSRLDSVEVAYAAPIPANADIPPTTTIDLRGSQGYRSPAPGGIDVAFARLLPGGGGENVKIADVEFAWQLDHEDLPQSHFLQAGVGATPVGEWNDHGTAVLGELVGVASNNYGVSGIAPAARIGTSSVTGLDAFGIRGLTFYDVGNAVLVAAAAMDPGDVMLIEQHFKGPGSGTTCDTSCGCGEFEYVAMEYFPKEYDAISFATALGIVVVEAAGNGAMNLDAAQYDHLFDRNFRDSQAILVGAGKPASHAPECFSNFGSRLDVQGWGDSVATLGYGDNATLRANGGDSRQWYTRTFSGTSSATPIVAGAAALIQSIRKARGLPPLESAVMRDLLARTGTPQGAGSQIGPLPNLQAALKDTLPDDAEMAGITFDSPLIAGTTVGASVRWRNSGSFPWTPGNYRFTIPLNFDLVSGGNLSATVPPGEVATMPVQIRLPAEPQQYEVTFNFVRSDGSLNLIVGSSEGLFRVRLAGNSTQDAATLSGLDLSSHIIYHIDDDYHAATVSALNSGSRDWAANAGFHLRVLGPSSPGGQPQNPITSTVSRNHTAQLTAHFSCGGAGNRTVRLQMENPEGQPFGNIVSKTITCQHVASGHHPND